MYTCDGGVCISCYVCVYSCLVSVAAAAEFNRDVWLVGRVVIVDCKGKRRQG